MQRLTIAAKSPKSATALLKALAQFDPTLATDDDDRILVAIEVGSDQHAIEVLDAVREHFAGRAGDYAVSTVISLHERVYSNHDR